MTAIACISLYCLDGVAQVAEDKKSRYFPLCGCLFHLLSFLVFSSVPFKMFRLVLKITLRARIELQRKQEFKVIYKGINAEPFSTANSSFSINSIILCYPSSFPCCHLVHVVKVTSEELFAYLNSLWLSLVCSTSSALIAMIFFRFLFLSVFLSISPCHLNTLE